MLNPLQWKEFKSWFDKKASNSDLTASELQQLMSWLVNRSAKHDRSAEDSDTDTTGDGNVSDLNAWIKEKARGSDLTANELKELTEWLFSRSACSDTRDEGDQRGLKVWLEDKFRESDLTASELKELTKWLFSRSSSKFDEKEQE